MDNQNFATEIRVEQPPSEVYKAVNNPRAWWSKEIKGTTDQLNGEWNYQFGDNHRSKIRVIEMIPGKRIVWLVEENYFKNAKDQTETSLRFTQIGLTPAYDCYKSCEWAWTGFVQKSLQSLINTGKGQLEWYK